MARLRLYLPRVALVTLALLHWAGPFTALNQHESTRILIGALSLGAIFLALLGWSLKAPQKAYAAALCVFLTVVVVASLTGASPLLEGIVVKLVLAGALAIGLRPKAR